MPRFPAYPTHKNVIELLDITETNSAGSFRKNLLESTANKAQAIPFIDKTFLVKNIEETLDLIGYSMNFFRALRMMSWLMSVIISLLLILISGLHFSFMIFIFACILGSVIGWILPELFIQDTVKTQQYELLSAVPDFLEQLHMIVSSPGFESFGQAIAEIAPLSTGQMGKTLTNLVSIQPYISDDELLSRFTKICPDPLIQELQITFTLSSKFGGKLANKIDELAQFAQSSREQRAKEIGNKTSGLLLGPLLMFHLPALLVIFLIPFLFMLQKSL